MYYLTLSQTTNFLLFHLKELADDNLKFDENNRKFFKKGRKHRGKRAISPFTAVSSKDFYCRQVKTGVCLGKG